MHRNSLKMTELARYARGPFKNRKNPPIVNSDRAPPQRTGGETRGAQRKVQPVA
jgi:hypothetical protein